MAVVTTLTMIIVCIFVHISVSSLTIQWYMLCEVDGAHWACCSDNTGGSSASDADFSEDGSLLALAFQDVVRLLDPNSCHMLDDIISIDGNNSAIRYAVKINNTILACSVEDMNSELCSGNV